MLPNGRRLGAHLPLGHGMVRAADRAAEIGASAIQVFTDNPTSWRRRATLPHELPAFRERLAASDIAPIAVHAPYLVNLAGPDERTHERSIEVLVNELVVAAAYGARFVNVHIGSHRGTGVEAGIARLVDGLRTALDAVGDRAPDVTVLLENGSGSGFGLGSTVEELAAIDRAAAAAGIGPERLGYCLDAAHLWGAGYEIRDRAGVDATLAQVDRRLGVGRVRLVHLNDSRAECGSRADRHEHVGAGRIGGAGLGRLLTHPALDHVAYILETPGMDEGYDAVNIERALTLAEGRALEDLPPAAFRTKGGRRHSAPAESHEDAVPVRVTPVSSR